MNPLLEVAAAVVPSVGVGLIFWFAVRAIIQADRRERLALARLEAEESARNASERPGDASE